MEAWMAWPIIGAALGMLWLWSDRRELSQTAERFRTRVNEIETELAHARLELDVVRKNDPELSGSETEHDGNWHGTFTQKRSKALLVRRFGLICWGCGTKTEALQVDHIRARKAKYGIAGDDELYNLALLCGPCNRRKSNTMTMGGLRWSNRNNSRLRCRWSELPDLFEAQQWAVKYLRAYDRPYSRWR